MEVKKALFTDTTTLYHLSKGGTGTSRDHLSKSSRRLPGRKTGVMGQ